MTEQDSTAVEKCERCEQSLEGSGEGFVDPRYCDDCYDDITDLAGESARDNIDIVVKGGMPCIDLPGAKIRLRCFMEHERFPDESIECDDLDVRREMLPDGTVWTLETEGEHLLNLTIVPELMEE